MVCCVRLAQHCRASYTTHALQTWGLPTISMGFPGQLLLRRTCKVFILRPVRRAWVVLRNTGQGEALGAMQGRGFVQCRFEGRGGLPAFATRTAGQSMERSVGGVRVPRLPHEEVPACSPQRGSGVGHLCAHQKEGGEPRGGDMCDRGVGFHGGYGG